MVALADIESVARRAYADLIGMARDMWPVLLTLCALYVLAVMGYFALPLLVDTKLGETVLRLLDFIGVTAIAAPYYIALHRYVAFGEARWLPRAGAYMEALPYIAYASFLETMWFAPMIAAEILDAFGADVLSDVALGLGFFASWAIAASLSTLLPMAALNPRRASAARAFAQVRGRFWYVFAATNGPASPAVFALVILANGAGLRTIGAVPFAILGLAAMLMLQLTPLAVATRLWQRLEAR